MAIAQHPSVVIDCPDASSLAKFYAELLGWDTKGQDGWIEIRPADGSSIICFQQINEGYQPPVWPGQEHPQQMHLDFVVADLDAGEVEVLRLGATKAQLQPGSTFRVFLDPAGHPFCLCSA
ncbi:VOC family protein [Arthrobacter alpinus]|nr:VOC family protein [Arthrobacter alpinus]